MSNDALQWIPAEIVKKAVGQQWRSAGEKDSLPPVHGFINQWSHHAGHVDETSLYRFVTEGVNVRAAQPPDVLYIVNLQHVYPQQVSQVAAAIKQAHSALDPAAAVARIGELWAGLDDTADVAEARMQLLLGRVAAPPQGDLPMWAATQMAELESSVPSAVLDRTRRLIQACIPSIEGRDIVAEIDSAGPFKVSIDWQGFPTLFRWIVEPCEMPWPGVRAKVYDANPENPANVRQHRYYEAGRVLQHLQGKLGAMTRDP